MKDDYLDDGENKSAASGTLSYMSQQFVPYAKLNTNQGQDPDQGQDQDGGADADADQHSGTDADSDDDSELDLYINKFANRELDPSSAAAASDSPDKSYRNGVSSTFPKSRHAAASAEILRRCASVGSRGCSIRKAFMVIHSGKKQKKRDTPYASECPER